MVAVKADAASRRQTQTILYSCDEGTEWTEYKFTDHNIVVDGVLNEPGITTTKVRYVWERGLSIAQKRHYPPGNHHASHF